MWWHSIEVKVKTVQVKTGVVLHLLIIERVEEKTSEN